MLSIEAYGLLSDLHSAALVGNDGSIDWWCAPRFDSPACFAALLGKPEHGRWLIAPTDKSESVQRAYRPGSLVLDSERKTATGRVRTTDCLLPHASTPRLLRVVECLSGTVEMHMQLAIRFYYGNTIPWVRRSEHGLYAIAGPDALLLHSDVPIAGRDTTTVAEFTLKKGQRAHFMLTWHDPSEPAPPGIDFESALEDAVQWWESWAAKCTYKGLWKDEVLSSLTVLKGMTYAPTGGIIAAPTTSLPENVGGKRNWDYRYCWLRDATLSISTLMLGGFKDEAIAWRDWLLRAVAGDMSQLQIVYGVAGERFFREQELSWLRGYEDSQPVRVGNAASQQVQWDVHGEIMDALYLARESGIPPDEWAWKLQHKLLDCLEKNWHQPDHGIWEVRGPKRHFIHSKVMAWTAYDRAVKTVEKMGLPGPVERWRKLRDDIHEEVCTRGYDKARGTFTQYYGSEELDSSVLMMPLVGFLPATDRRMVGTVEALERHLVRDGLIHRYSDAHRGHVDGVAGNDAAFLPCNFWLADNYLLQGKEDKAVALFEKLLKLRNDLGLLAEEYDAHEERQLGNFPQAFSHLCLINTAFNLNAKLNKG